MKIQCAKKFNSLDSMIQDMENALDEAEVHSSEDITAAEDDEEFKFTLQDAKEIAWDIVSTPIDNALYYGIETSDFGIDYYQIMEDYEDNADAREMIDNCLYDALNTLSEVCKNKNSSNPY